MKGVAHISIVLMVVVVVEMIVCVIGMTVEYDHRAVVIDGKRRVLMSGSIHYPRSTPEMWPDLIQKSKDGGLDVIETYVFWNSHEPVQNQFDFQGRNDLVKFVKTVAEAGLYVHLRIGPYVCAEWNYGGFPLWLHFIPGIQFRTDNEPFKREMQKFTAKIVSMMKEEKLFASQGGPIILSQIENEYGNIDTHYGSAAKSYINWAAGMAISLDTGVPWVMCQQANAPDPIINTCNGFYCDQFTPNSVKKPKMWTENWTGWFQTFGGAVPYRPVEDIAFSVARFVQRGGTFQNYYMYHGGTNFGRTSGGPFITTSYDYDAPIDEYGLIRQPKWGHLKDLHKAIKLCEPALIATDPKEIKLGDNLEGHVYKTEAGVCSAFLANTGTQSDATVNFNGNSYHLPAWSVSILPDCKNVIFNSAKINSQVVKQKFHRQSDDKIDNSAAEFQSGWSWFVEPVGISKSDAFSKQGLLEQINTTSDVSDYLWYSLSTEIKENEPLLQGDSQPTLHVESLGHALNVFINGKLAGSGKGSSGKVKISLEVPITLVPGKNSIDLMSATVGLQNYGAFYELTGAGITGPVTIKGLKNGASLDLSSTKWTYQIGLKGEELGLYDGSYSQWVSDSAMPKHQPLTWYKTSFDAPAGSDPIALDFTGMGKGEAWVNAIKEPIVQPSVSKSCGKPSQTLYHVPRSWVKPSGNVLVLFEELGGNPTQLSFATRQADSLCAHVSESHPPPVESWTSDAKTKANSRPVLQLECPSPNQVISSIKFASFGTPYGTCGTYGHGRCSSVKALTIVKEACVGLKSCQVEVSSKNLGDPCKDVPKSLAVEAICA
ncbi:hypothetical protein MKW92_030529 [Papaver armeniacum]|nr:hypothetical protein MKW92_030529 [Papaver armeniacum]